MEGTLAKKILVADDEEEVLVHLTNMLKRAKHEILSTSKGKEVTRLAKEFKPDLIVLDIVMPDMDGGEVASALSQDTATADIPIIYLTALITKNEESLVKRSGKHYLIAKPTTAEELLGLIDKVFLDRASS